MSNFIRLIVIFSVLLMSASQLAWSKEKVVTKEHVAKSSKRVALEMKKGTLWRIDLNDLNTSKVVLKTSKKLIALKKFVGNRDLKSARQLLISSAADQMPISNADVTRLESLISGESIIVQSGTGDPGDFECWCESYGYGCALL